MKNQLSTKIIATLGPSSESPEKISELIKAGVSTFRLNSSHGSPEIHRERIENIRKIAKDLNVFIPVLLDLQGPKIRIGELKQPLNLNEGDKVVFKPSVEPSNGDFIPLNHIELYKDLCEGSMLMLDDGKIQIKALRVDSEKIEALVIDGGVLTSKKGVNIPGATFSIDAITPQDVEYIKFSVENNVDYIALSFVRSKEDILEARRYITQFGGDIPIIAKIEKPEAVDNLDDIIAVSNGVMVARGDLGIEISPHRVPIVQKHIINQSNFYGKVVITATQMLESMMQEPIPTRAEASDIANAILDGTDAVMLSGETAVGEYPLEAVSIMGDIAENVESSDLLEHNIYEVHQPIVNAATKMLDEMDISAIVALTRSGETGVLLSKAKPSVPVITLSDSEEVCARLNLLWGVYPLQINFTPNFTEEFLQEIDELLVNQTFLKKGDKIIITGGMPCLTKGSTNFIRIHEIEE